MSAIIALALKDIRLLLRDRVGFIFAFAFPLVMAVFFGTIFSGQGGGESAGIPIVLVDADDTDASRRFIDSLAKSDSLEVSRAQTRDAAADLVRRGKRTAFVLLQPGFGPAWESPFRGVPAELELGVDPARSAEAGMLEGLLTERLFSGLQGSFTDPDQMRAQARRSIDDLSADPDASPALKAVLIPFLNSLDTLGRNLPSVTGDGGEGRAAPWTPFSITKADIARERSGPQNAYAISFPQGAVWALIGCTTAFALSLVVERTRGTMGRLRLAPIGYTHILAGKALACFLTLVAVITLLLVIARSVFHVVPSSVPLLVAAVLCSGVCFVGLMMLLAVLGRTEAAAGGIGWAVMLAFAMIGGGMVPLFVMPGWMQQASVVSPVRWAVLALEGAIWRGFSGAEMALPCAVLLAVGAAAFAAGAAAFRRLERA